jgi:hypothetical protein
MSQDMNRHSTILGQLPLNLDSLESSVGTMQRRITTVEQRVEPVQYLPDIKDDVVHSRDILEGVYPTIRNIESRFESFQDEVLCIMIKSILKNITDSSACM